MKNSDKNTNIFLDGCNNHLFIELSDYEASINTGGFTVANKTDKSVDFYTWGPASAPTKFTLPKNKSKNFSGKYVLYDSNLDKKFFVPVLSEELDNGGEYSFTSEDNQLDFSGAEG
ncbi:MAG: hypothetical protein RMX35_10640 [Nostoc sp. DcaGUA01]|nr:hypothetical protein [Nostoc sp. DcaGUA01]